MKSDSFIKGAKERSVTEQSIVEILRHMHMMTFVSATNSGLLSYLIQHSKLLHKPISYVYHTNS